MNSTRSRSPKELRAAQESAEIEDEPEGQGDLLLWKDHICRKDSPHVTPQPALIAAAVLLMVGTIGAFAVLQTGSPRVIPPMPRFGPKRPFGQPINTPWHHT